jgi:hypothetical protein
MPLIADYTTLQTTIATWLNRDDLAADIPNFIQNAEARLKDDDRARLMGAVEPFTASTPTTSLPADFDALISIDHVGPTFFGPVETVGTEQLGEAMARFGTTGPPSFAAVITDGSPRIKWAPAPDASYDLSMTYWAKLVGLSGANPTNRLLLRRPDVYLYAALVESAPFLKNDPRLAVWEGELESRLNALEAATTRALESGTLEHRPGRVF